MFAKNMITILLNTEGFMGMPVSLQSIRSTKVGTGECFSEDM